MNCIVEVDSTHRTIIPGMHARKAGDCPLGPAERNTVYVGPRKHQTRLFDICVHASCLQNWNQMLCGCQLGGREYRRSRAGHYIL